MHVQSHHLRGLSREALAHGAAPFLAARGVDVAPDEPLLLDAVDCVRDRATTFADVAERVDYFFRDPPEQEEKAVKKHFKPKFLDGVERYRAMLEDVEVWDAPSLDAATQAWMEETDLGFRDFAQAVRVALSGRSATPGLYEVMTVLGRARSLTRLDAGIAQLRASADD